MIPLVDVPEGKSGKWSVRRFEIDKKSADLFNLKNFMSSARAGVGLRQVIPGTYTKLIRDQYVIMSDTPAEQSDHYWPIHYAEGTCLINGLGLGLVANAMLLKPKVDKVYVVEKDKDVIKLVAPHYEAKFGKRIQIYHADAYEFQPPKGILGAVWHDIWDSISADNIEGMTRLHRKYGRRTVWQGSWCKQECLRLRKIGY